jgi:hypothetical protein
VIAQQPTLPEDTGSVQQAIVINTCVTAATEPIARELGIETGARVVVVTLAYPVGAAPGIT